MTAALARRHQRRTTDVWCVYSGTGVTRERCSPCLGIVRGRYPDVAACGSSKDEESGPDLVHADWAPGLDRTKCGERQSQRGAAVFAAALGRNQSTTRRHKMR